MSFSLPKLYSACLRPCQGPIQKNLIAVDLMEVFPDITANHIIFSNSFFRFFLGDVPGGPVAETLHSQGGVLGSILDWGTRSCMPQLRPDAAK